MFYIAALGNPGEEYVRTRHNAGRFAVNTLCARAGFSSLRRDERRCVDIAEGDIAGAPVVALFPDTFMNDSGRAVAAVVPRADIARLIVVHDDVDLPFGTIRSVFGRGAGGHNGVTSIISALGSKDFHRVRIGVGRVRADDATAARPKSEELSRYVLGEWTKGEEAALPEVLERAALAIEGTVERERRRTSKGRAGKGK